MSRFWRASCALSAAAAILPHFAAAQTTTLPPITVEAARPASAARSQSAPAQAGPGSTSTAAPIPGTAPANQSLTLPNVEQARTAINYTPGAVSIVGAEEWREQRTATVKDMFDFVPGVWAQPKWGEDSRLSIRGSGLSRNFHGRSLQLYVDGIPINTSDGYFDLQEIDPSAYRYAEVFRGASALQFGSNSLGGAINFVTPSGRNAEPFAFSSDIGSFGYRRIQSSSGAAIGPFDYFVTGSFQQQDGFREHSNGNLYRGFANVGYQVTPNVETRFYFNGSTIEQRIPGAVTKTVALSQPRMPARINWTNDYQRNINANRVANKTAFRFENTTVEVGAFSTDRHLMHPIFQWIDHTFGDYGVFGKMVDDRNIGGYRNRFVAGFNILNGENNNLQFVNGPLATRGALTFSALDKAKNTSAYVENWFYVVPSVAAVVGTQFLSASRERFDRFLSNGDQSGWTQFDIWSPKYGLLWDVSPTAQVFANISRSAEVPSFGEGSTAMQIPFWQIKAQRGTTYEIGTRGRQPDVTWDIAVYRANIRNELQCFSTPAVTGSCDVLNADRTVHQGVEISIGAALLKSMFVHGANPDKLWFQIAYTYSDFFYDGDPLWGDNTLPGAPPHYMRAELLYRHPAGWFFGPNVEWVPQPYYVDAANTFMTDPYMLWGVKAGYDDNKRFSVYIEGRNLANRAYVSSASIARVASVNSALFEPGSGRAVFAGMKMKW